MFERNNNKMRDITFALLLALAVILSIFPQLIQHNFDYETLTIYCFGFIAGACVSFLIFFKFVDNIEKNGRNK